MSFIVEAFFSGCISKVVNDGTDFSIPRIKSALNDKKNRNLPTKVYRVIERALNIVTDKKYKGTDISYDAIERIFIEFRENGDTLESVKCGLGLLVSDVSDQKCESFLDKFYDGVCQDEDLYKRISLILKEKGIKINQQEFQQLNENIEGGFAQLNRKIDEKISINNKNDNKYNLQNRVPVKSRTQEYADKWNANMFLNSFSDWDENAGVNVALKDVYIDEHLPHFIYKHGEKEFDNLDVLLSKHIMKTNENKMLLILGQPGIGKSTLITWITVNFADRVNDILVYRFASDLGNTDWKNGRISNRVLEELGLDHSDLDGKILILDGFDEVNIEANRRKDILDSLYGDWIYNKIIDKFSLIITCRENYVPQFAILKCQYITLQPWDEIQIKSFCNIFYDKTKDSISETTIEKLCENKEILGIPLILYMVLALNISIEKEGSIVDVYDKIFSLEGGIYDRCIDNKMFADKHRISEVKECIHQISREIAIWMFENNPVGAYISKEEYQIICANVMQEQGWKKDDAQPDFLIGNYFKLVKHCNGMETEELYFVHRSIYEYFVAETIFSSIKNALIDQSVESQGELAKNIAFYLKQGRIDITIGQYLQFMFFKLYNSFDNSKRQRFYPWFEEVVVKMMNNGMFYYTEKNIQDYKNIIINESQCFLNLLKITRLLNKQNGLIMKHADRNMLERYIRFRLIEVRIELPFGTECLNLSNLYLKDIDLSGEDFGSVNFNKSNLEKVNFTRAYLEGADFCNANLRGANLREANLINANLKGADLEGANLDESKWFNENILKVLPQLKNTIFDIVNIG